MGGTITLAPDGTIGTLTYGWTAVGGTLITAVNDVSDATYIHDGSPSGSNNTHITWTFATSTLPAGAAVKLAYPVIRNAQATGNRKLSMSLGTYNPPDGISYQSPAKIWTPVVALADTVGSAAGAVPQSRSQGVVDLLIVSAQQTPASNFSEDHRIYKVDAKVVYVDSPLASDAALYPASANTLTTRPGVQWTYNSVDGFTQYEYRVALWKLSELTLHTGTRAGFEAAPADIFENASFTGTDALQHSAVWRSNGGAAKSWVVSTDTNVTPSVDLDGTSQYVYYIQVSALHVNERLAHPTSFASLDFTQAITVPTQPSAITPTWQRDFQFRTQVQVTVPAATLGSWTGRKVYVERRISGAPVTAWTLLPLGTQEVGAGAATWTFWDTLPAVNRVLEYRTRAVYWNTLGYTSTSTYRTSSTITADFVGFVLRDPLDDDSAVVFRILGDFVADQEEVQGKFRPLASQYPVIVSDAVLGKTWSVDVRVKDQITEAYIDALRAKQSPLVLQTDMTDTWYWVRIGPNVNKKTLRQADRRDATKREQIWTMTLIEVNAIPGQPQVYF
jgi:hypothetical protein